MRVEINAKNQTMEQHSIGEEIFLRISVHLTGFERVDLQATGMLEAYYKKTLDESLKTNDGAMLQSFLTEAEKILDNHAGNDKSIANEIGANLIPYAKFNTLIKNIITLWYTGNWGSDVLSPNSYVQGLIWDVAESHPPGAKQPGYGSWAVKPFNTHQEIT